MLIWLLRLSVHLALCVLVFTCKWLFLDWYLYLNRGSWTLVPPLSTGVPITDPKYFSQMSVEELGHVLRSDNQTPMPMLQERHQVPSRTQDNRETAIIQIHTLPGWLDIGFTVGTSVPCVFAKRRMSHSWIQSVLLEINSQHFCSTKQQKKRSIDWTKKVRGVLLRP